MSRETISRITDKVIEEMNDWQVRPLDEIYAAIFIDAIVVKVRDGQVANRPFYAAIGVTLAGEKDILGLWAGTGGEGAKFWMSVLTDLRNRGVRDVFFVVCDGLKGLPEVVGNVWPQAIVQTCIIHLIRNTFRLASKRDWDEIKRDVKTDLHRGQRRRGPGGVRRAGGEAGGSGTRRSSGCGTTPGSEFIPFLDYDVEIRTVHLLDERDRVTERPVPAGDQGPRPFPDRAGGDEVPLPGDPFPGPDRYRQGTMDDAVEASAQRIRHHLRRPVPGRRDLLTMTAGNTVSEIDPVFRAAILRTGERPAAGATRTASAAVHGKLSAAS